MMLSTKRLLLEGSSYKLIFIVALFLGVSTNSEFYSQTLAVYPLNTNNFMFLLSLVMLLVLVMLLLLSLLNFKLIIKPLLIITLLISAMSSYFMNTYHVVIDEVMIQNIVETNSEEVMDLLSLKQMFYFIVFGLTPSIFVYKFDVIPSSIKKELLTKTVVVVSSLLGSVLLIFLFSKHYTSFFREHKPLRFYTNPSYWIYATGKYVGMKFSQSNHVMRAIGEDADITEETHEAKELVILVVGETARADRFSLNGYERKTNPLLEKESLINFEQMYSCGTSTAVSVPCMFSVYDNEDYSYNKANTTENILDILTTSTQVEMLWRDNNSDSKGVALRIPYENYRTPENNTICDKECRDEGMLVGLDTYIQKHQGKDILIILHQMGNHGPAYYKRYPKSFEKFTPVCETNQLEECSQEEISNAYDNAILYTDYFLAKTINFLKQYDETHETAMIYMSDHGESLGENGIYLHGLPYFMAPVAQKHIPSVMWFGKGMKEEMNMKALKNREKREFSQDNLFHTLLGIFEVQTTIYDESMDILH